MNKKVITMADWRLRLAVNAALALSATAGLYVYDAPAWPIVLVLYMSTQPSRLDLAGDVAALQSTLRAGQQTGEPDASPADPKLCPSCGGRGYMRDRARACGFCGGRGVS